MQYILALLNFFGSKAKTMTKLNESKYNYFQHKHQEFIDKISQFYGY